MNYTPKAIINPAARGRRSKCANMGMKRNKWQIIRKILALMQPSLGDFGKIMAPQRAVLPAPCCSASKEKEKKREWRSGREGMIFVLNATRGPDCRSSSLLCPLFVTQLLCDFPDVKFASSLSLSTTNILFQNRRFETTDRWEKSSTFAPWLRASHL